MGFVWGWVHFTIHRGTCETMGLRAIFIAPTKGGYVHRRTLPQSRIRSTAPSGREPGMGAYHSTCRSETGRLRAIFIAPTKALIFLHFTIQRGTLPQSRPLGVTAPSERELRGYVQAPPWMYLWSQSASKRRLPSSMGQPLHRSSASSRRVSAGSRHSV